MAERLRIHPETPQPRLIHQAVEALRSGGVVAYPTDTTYALGAQIGDKRALERICRLRRIDDRHDFTLMCRDLSESGIYARFDTPVYRLLKAHTPGPYTFLLSAAKEVPRRLQHPKKKTIGLRVPDHRITLAILEEIGSAIFTTTLRLPGDDYPLSDPDDIYDRVHRDVDVIVDGGPGGLDPTSVIDLTGNEPVVIRESQGDISAFL